MRRSRLSRLIMLVGITLLGLSSLPYTASVHAGTTTYWPDNFNGVSVYLSPANQPDNIGCDGYPETDGARAMADAAKDLLLGFGYLVYVGDGVVGENIADSNALRPNLHVPIHSNAPRGDWDCEGLNPLNGGTWLLYRAFDESGIAASQQIYNQLAASSPETNDRIGTDQDLVGGILDETQLVAAPTAFVEAAFHTYGPDVEWLRITTTNGQNIARGIDLYFGQPRCIGPCPQSITPGPTVKRPTFAVPPDDLTGKESTLLHEILEQVLSGTDNTTDGVTDESSWFSEETADFLLSASITPDGIAVINVADWSAIIPNASTSAGSRDLLQELNTAVFSVPEVQSVTYQFDGSCEAFWQFLQAPCQLITRDQWQNSQE